MNEEEKHLYYLQAHLIIMIYSSTTQFSGVGTDQKNDPQKNLRKPFSLWNVRVHVRKYLEPS